MKVVDFVFTWTGARFYMDWLLPTNPKSKNPLIHKWAATNHWTFGNLQKVHSGKNPRRRIVGGIIWIVLHVLLAILMFQYLPDYWLLANLYINIYPIIVQIYIIYRCWKRLTR